MIVNSKLETLPSATVDGISCPFRVAVHEKVPWLPIFWAWPVVYRTIRRARVRHVGNAMEIEWQKAYAIDLVAVSIRPRDVNNVRISTIRLK